MTDYDNEGIAKVAELIKGTRVAMLTCSEEDGSLVSRPMATQDVDFTGDVWFIAERNAHQTRCIQARPRVNVAYSGKNSWVSVSGTAEVVDDTAKLEDMWNTFTDAWMEGGPDNPENILLRIRTTGAEYWESPGTAVTQVANVVKAKVTGQRLDPPNETVDLT